MGTLYKSIGHGRGWTLSLDSLWVYSVNDNNPLKAVSQVSLGQSWSDCWQVGVLATGQSPGQTSTKPKPVTRTRLRSRRQAAVRDGGYYSSCSLVRGSQWQSVQASVR